MVQLVWNPEYQLIIVTNTQNNCDDSIICYNVAYYYCNNRKVRSNQGNTNEGNKYEGNNCMYMLQASNYMDNVC